MQNDSDGHHGRICASGLMLSMLRDLCWKHTAGAFVGLYVRDICCKLKPIRVITKMMMIRLADNMTGLQSTMSMRTFVRVCVLGIAVMTGACVNMQGGGLFSADGDISSAQMDARMRALWAAGVEAESANNYELAIKSFSNLYERQPEDAKVLAAVLRNLRYAGQALDAVNYADLKAGPLLDHKFVKFEYAKAQLAAGRKADALKTLQAVAGLMPGNWEVYSAIGIASDSSGQYIKAIAAYKTALQYSPDNVVVMNNLAISQAMSGQLQVAISTLEAAAALNRTNTHIRQNLALLYAANGDSQKARALAAMDLDSSDLETNLSFYRRFGRGAP